MNLKFLGGWFLAIAGIAILLTMGCEKGSLGVKPAIVTGRVVDSDSGNGIPGATIRMISKEKFGTGEIKQGNNFASAITGTTGQFIFENVVPDNVVFEFFAKGFSQAIFPMKTVSVAASGDATSVPEQVAEVEAVYVRSGTVLNLGDLKLKAQSVPSLAATMTVRIDLVDATTKKQIVLNNNGVEMDFTLSFNGVPSTKTAAEWRTTGITDLATSRTMKVIARHEPTAGESLLYLAKTVDYPDVTGDLIEIIELDPVTYSIQLRCVNVPDYIDNTVVNILAETSALTPAAPPQVLAKLAMENLGDLSSPSLPKLLEIPGLAMPVDLRIEVRGYEDEVLRIYGANLPEGSQGSYRIDIDFLASNDVASETFGFYSPVENPATRTYSKASLFDNMKRRDIMLSVAGEDLKTDYGVSAMINLPHGDVSYNGVVAPFGTSADLNMPVYVLFEEVAIGYNLFYNVTVSGSASGSFNVFNEDGIMVNPNVETPGKTLAFGVNAKRPTI